MPTKVKAVSAAMDRPNSSAQGCGMAGTSTMGAASMWAISATAATAQSSISAAMTTAKAPKRTHKTPKKKSATANPASCKKRLPASLFVGAHHIVRQWRSFLRASRSSHSHSDPCPQKRHYAQLRHPPFLYCIVTYITSMYRLLLYNNYQQQKCQYLF